MRNPFQSCLGVLAVTVTLLVQPVFSLEPVFAQDVGSTTAVGAMTLPESLAETPVPTVAQAAVETEAPWAPDTGDTTWLLVCSALVLAMTAPGLAIFYGGMARKKNALNTIMISFVVLCLISVQWVLWGYSLAFVPTSAK